MSKRNVLTIGLGAGVFLLSGLLPGLVPGLVPGLLPRESIAQQIEQKEQIWVTSVIREFGQPVIPTFDGWFANEDGTKTLCYGYFNLNSKEVLEIPHGELNYLSHDDYKFASPTHFDPYPSAYRRKFCVFTSDVPADFPQNETVVWHLTSAGQELTVPGHVLPAYVLDEPDSIGRGRHAPRMLMPGVTGEGRGRRGVTFDRVLTTNVGESLSIPFAIEHENENVWVGWTKFSGAGDVTFDNVDYDVPADGSAQTQGAVFNAPGDYLIQLQSISSTADFEFFCCHSNAYFKVTVR